MTIYIADKSTVFSEFLANFLSTTIPDACIEDFTCSADVLKRYNLQRPDVIIMDISLEDGTSLSLVETLRKIGYCQTIIVMSLFDAPEYHRAALEAGANLFISKPEVHTLLIDSILSKNTGTLHVA